MPIKLVSVSGGKDSTATLLLALEQHPQDEIFAAFADTGNEHESTYAYVDYLERQTGVRIRHVKADFSDRWARRIEIAEWERLLASACKRQASTFFHKGPVEAPGDMSPSEIMRLGNINEMVSWSQTKRGGRKFDLFSVFEESEACSSSYGLCE